MCCVIRRIDYTSIAARSGATPAAAIAADANTPGIQILEARNLIKTYPRRGFRGRATMALDNVSVLLRRGETLGLVGESGSGKSTLARALTCLAPADSGDVLLDGEQLAYLSRRQLRPISQACADGVSGPVRVRSIRARVSATSLPKAR